jgi:hypothetical protein
LIAAKCFAISKHSTVRDSQHEAAEQSSSVETLNPPRGHVSTLQKQPLGCFMHAPSQLNRSRSEQRSVGDRMLLQATVNRSNGAVPRHDPFIATREDFVVVHHSRPIASKERLNPPGGCVLPDCPQTKSQLGYQPKTAYDRCAVHAHGS